MKLEGLFILPLIHFFILRGGGVNQQQNKDRGRNKEREKNLKGNKIHPCELLHLSLVVEHEI